MHSPLPSILGQSWGPQLRVPRPRRRLFIKPPSANEAGLSQLGPNCSRPRSARSSESTCCGRLLAVVGSQGNSPGKPPGRHPWRPTLLGCHSTAQNRFCSPEWLIIPYWATGSPRNRRTPKIFCSAPLQHFAEHCIHLPSIRRGRGNEGKSRGREGDETCEECGNSCGEL